MTSLAWEPWLRRELVAYERNKLDVRYPNSSDLRGVSLEKFFTIRAAYTVYGSCEAAAKMVNLRVETVRTAVNRWGMLKKHGGSAGRKRREDKALPQNHASHHEDSIFVNISRWQLESERLLRSNPRPRNVSRSMSRNHNG